MWSRARFSCVSKFRRRFRIVGIPTSDGPRQDVNSFSRGAGWLAVEVVNGGILIAWAAADMKSESPVPHRPATGFLTFRATSGVAQSFEARRSDAD